MSKSLKYVVVQSSDNEMPNNGVVRNVTFRALNSDGTRDNSRSISLSVQNPGTDDVYPLHTEYAISIDPVAKSK